MNSSIFEANLDILRRRRSQAAGELLAATSEYPGSVGPVSGWEQDANSQNCLIVLGLGCGGEIAQLWQEREQTLGLLLIIEYDISRAKAVLSRVRLSHILEDQRVHLFVGLPPEELRRTLFPFRYFLGTREPGIVSLADKASLSAFRNALESELLLIRQNADLVIQEKGRTLFNVLRNLPAIVNATSVQELHGRCAREPAFVVAAGPSLDKNISYLSQARDCGWIIAVDTAFAPLRQAGVAPQILVTLDPTALNERHFTGWPSLRETILAFHPEVYAEIPRAYLGKSRLLVLHDGENPLLRALGLLPPPGEGLVRGAMTGHLAFNLAVYLGCDPIVLVGMDLAFPPVGGSTHASAAALGRIVQSSESGKATVGPIPNLAKEMETELVELPGMGGGTVCGPPIFHTYLTLMEQEIAHCDRRVIDATEGGAQKARTEVMPLTEAIQVAQAAAPPVHSHPPLAHSTTRPSIEVMLNVLHEGRKRLAELKDWGAEPHQVEEWRARLLQNPDDWLLPTYEALIYNLHDLQQPIRDQPSLAELTKDLNQICEYFDLFILGAIEELKTLTEPSADTDSR